MSGTEPAYTSAQTAKNPIANPLVLLREEFDDWAVLFNPDFGDGYGLNPISVFIWKNLDGKNSIPEIAVKLKEEVEDPPKDIETQIQIFIDELLNKGLAGYAEN